MFSMISKYPGSLIVILHGYLTKLISDCLINSGRG